MFDYLFLLVLGVGVVIYLLDRKGWNATLKRLSKIIRSYVESAKPIKTIEKKVKQQELDTWTAEFEGKSVDTCLKHEIVRTWYAKKNSSVYPHFKCKCGYSDWHVTTEMAKSSSRQHVKEQNNAEELMKKNGGSRAW